MIKKCKELCNKIRNSISSITKNNDEKYMKTKLNSDDDLPLNKTLEIRSMILTTINILNVHVVDYRYIISRIKKKRCNKLNAKYRFD